MLPSLRHFMPRGGNIRPSRLSKTAHRHVGSHNLGRVTLKVETIGQTASITLGNKFSSLDAMDHLLKLARGRQAVVSAFGSGFSTVRMYCTSKEEKKNENEKKDEERVDVDARPSPFGRPPVSEKSEVPKEESEASSFKFVPPEGSNFENRAPAGKIFTPSYIITINTEKGLFKKLWRGMGLISFNFVIAAKSWKTTPSGAPIPAFWEKQIHQGRLDALLLLWAICAITGADIMAFLIWMVGAIAFPAQLVPSVLRTPSRAEVKNFVLEHLGDLDTEGTGRVPIADAKRVLWVVEKEMSPDVIQLVLDSADADEQTVDYVKLADIVIGNKTSSEETSE